MYTLSLALSGLAPCRLTETPSKHDSQGSRRYVHSMGVHVALVHIV